MVGNIPTVFSNNCGNSIFMESIPKNWCLQRRRNNNMRTTYNYHRLFMGSYRKLF